MQTKRIVGRAIDAVTIALLVFGPPDAREFATYLAAAMAAVALLSLAGLTKEAAQEIHGSRLRRTVAWSITLAYTAALVVSGSPGVALFYLVCVAALRLHAQGVLEKAAAG